MSHPFAPPIPPARTVRRGAAFAPATGNAPPFSPAAVRRHAHALGAWLVGMLPLVLPMVLALGLIWGMALGMSP